MNSFTLFFFPSWKLNPVFPGIDVDANANLKTAVVVTGLTNG